MSVAVSLAVVLTGIRVGDVLTTPGDGSEDLSVRPKGEKRRTLQAYAGFDAYPTSQSKEGSASASTPTEADGVGGEMDGSTENPSAGTSRATADTTAGDDVSTTTRDAFDLPVWQKRSFENVGIHDWLSLRLVGEGLGPRELAPWVHFRGASSLR